MKLAGPTKHLLETADPFATMAALDHRSDVERFGQQVVPQLRA